MKKILLSLTMVLAIVALASCSLNSKTTIEFTKLPETVYEAGDYSPEQINAKLAAISVKVSDVETEIDLTNKILTVSGFDAATLKTPGSYNLVVVYGTASVVFNYTVVEQVKTYEVGDEDKLIEALNAGGIIELTNTITLTKALQPKKSVVINGNNYSINVEKTSIRYLLQIEEVSNIKVTLNDVKLDSKGETCIRIKNTQNVEVLVNNCYLNAATYTVNPGSGNEGLKIYIDKSELRGWGLINHWSNGSEFLITNSKLYSYSDKTDKSNGFGAIVLNGGARDPENHGISAGDTGQDNTLTFEKCEFVVELSEQTVLAGVNQVVVLIQDSCGGNVLNFNECTFEYHKGMFYTRDAYNPAANAVYIDGVRK